MLYQFFETSVYLFFEASVLTLFLYLSIKCYKKIFLYSNNWKFYNEIVLKKNVYVISETEGVEFINLAIEKFKEKTDKFIAAGFDCEWSPNKNVSLIQIAFPDGSCFLLRVLNSVEYLPNEFLIWMKDSTKLKFGIGILEDCKKLESQWNISVRGSVDLRHLAVRIKPNGLDKMGLKSFALHWLGLNYPYDDESRKTLLVQCSDWEQEILTSKQLEYASLDGLVGALCPIEFLCRKLKVTPNEAIMSLENIRTYCQGCIDLRFKSKAKTEKKIHLKPTIKSSIFNRTTPIYDNTILMTPDGEMLSRLSRKKADWYLKRGLGEKISDDPLVVKLLFEPSGRASGENDYYVQMKENLCVVCGSKEGCVKKNIIPIEYRRHYPVSHKSHKSHDVLPLCVNCHRMSNVIDDHKKKQISIEYDAPLGSRDSVLNKTDFGRSRVKNSARALLYQGKIPLERVEELKLIVAEFYDVNLSENNNEIPEEVLADAIKLEIVTRDGKFVPHGEKVVSSLDSSVSLANFEVMWREHFVEAMQPKYLPIGWSTHHRIDRYSTMEIE